MKKGKLQISTVALLLVGVLAAGIAVTMGVVAYGDGDEFKAGWTTMRPDGFDRSGRLGGMPYMRNPGGFTGRSGYRMSFAGWHGGAGSGFLAVGAGLLAGTLYARRKRHPVESGDVAQEPRVEE
jgi:hypothetical protein